MTTLSPLGHLQDTSGTPQRHLWDTSGTPLGDLEVSPREAWRYHRGKPGGAVTVSQEQDVGVTVVQEWVLYSWVYRWAGYTRAVQGPGSPPGYTSRTPAW